MPDAVAQELGEKTRGIETHGPPVRWTPAGHMHLTLAFLGEVQEASLEGAAAAMRSVHGPSFEAEVGPVTGFPSKERCRVVVAEVRSPQLDELAMELADALRRAGFSLEARPFRGHITLGRVTGSARILHGPEVDLRLAIRRLELIESRPHDRVHRFRSLSSADLSEESD